jgi:hypothetical protein
MAKKKKRGLKEALDQTPMGARASQQAFKKRQMTQDELANKRLQRDLDDAEKERLNILLNMLGYENATRDHFLTSEYEFARNLLKKYSYPYLHNKGYEPEV